MTEYYVRRAGRVSGPFSVEKLLAEKRLKKLARFDELSRDGQNWQMAREFLEVFPDQSVPAGNAPGAEPDEEVSEPLESGTEDASDDWYCEVGGKEKGPFTFETIVELMDENILSASSMVWRKGLDKWEPIANIDYLARHLSRTAGGWPNASKQDVNEDYGKSRSRAWIIGGVVVAMMMVTAAIASILYFQRSENDGGANQNIAIQSILENDQLLRSEIDTPTSQNDLADEIRLLVSQLDSETLAECPPDFRVAFRRYLEELSALASIVEQLPDPFEEEMISGLLAYLTRSEIDGGVDQLQGDLKRAAEETKSSWRNVEDVALEYGVAL